MPAEVLLPTLMFVALIVLVLTSYPIAFVLGGLSVLFGCIGWAFGIFAPIEFFNFIGRIWFIAENMVIIAVPCFVLMGVLLERAEIARDLLETLQRLLHRVPGGMAMAVIVMGTIIAAITGIVGASVVVMTLIALGPMLRAGYRPALALGTIAAASTLGILIPPSILLVFVADLLGISEARLFASALFPGLALSALYLLFVFAVSILVPGMAPATRTDTPPIGFREAALLFARGVLPPVALIVMVLGSILVGFATVTESAAVGAGGAMLIARLRSRLGGQALSRCLHRSALLIGMIFFLYIGATCFSYVFRSLGGDDLILSIADVSGLGSWGVLITVIGLVFVMGFFFDVLEILLVALPVFVPLIGLLDFGDHLLGRDIVYWFAILVAVTLQTSFLTPPMGLALFYMKGVAPQSVTMRQIYIGIVPFVLLQLACVALIMRWPAVALWLPNRIFE